MQEHIKEVHIGKGLGTLRFGNTREQVLAMLGEPSEREKYSLSDLENDDTEAWHYDDLDLSLSFDEESDWKLSSIAVSSDGYSFEGVPLIGRKKEEVLKIFRDNGWGEAEEDEEVKKENSDNCLMHVDKASVSLWFDKDELTEMQIGPFYSAEEEDCD